MESALWIPPGAHSIKLDTYLQKVELGEKQVALGNRQVANSIRATRAAPLTSSPERARPVTLS